MKNHKMPCRINHTYKTPNGSKYKLIGTHLLQETKRWWGRDYRFHTRQCIKILSTGLYYYWYYDYEDHFYKWELVEVKVEIRSVGYYELDFI